MDEHLNNYTNIPESQEAFSKKQCVICEQYFSDSDLIEINGDTICAECKPVYLRLMQEGELAYYYQPAGFWIRFLAIFIDGLILMLVNLPFSLVLNYYLKSKGVTGIIITNLLGMVIPMFYEILMIHYKSATLGKMIMKIKVINTDGSEEISLSKSIGRYFAKILSGFILYIGYIMAAFDTEKRALHDRICNTRVVYNK